MMSIINLRSSSMRSMRSMRSMNNNVSRYLATSVKSTDSSSNDMANLLEKLQNISKSSNAATAADGVAPAASKIKRQFSGNKNKKKFNNNHSNNNNNNNNNNNRSSGNGNSSTGGKRSLSQKRPQNTRNKNFKKGGRNGRFNNNQGEFDSNFNDDHTIDNFQNDLEFEKNYINKLTNQKIEDYPNFKKFINNISNNNNNNNNNNSSRNKINSSGSIFQRIDEVDHKAIKESLISRYFDKKRELIFGAKPEQLIKFNDGELVDSEGKELTFERINEINSFFFNDKLYESTNSKSLINEYKIKDKQELGSLIINSTKSGINFNSRIIRLIENYLSINSGLNLNDLFKDLNKLNGLKIIPLTNKVYPYTDTTISSSLIRNLVSIKSLNNNKSNLNELINNIIKGKRNEIKLNSNDKLNLVKSVISNSLNSNSQLKINNLHLKINDIANGLQKINELPKAINPPKLLK